MKTYTEQEIKALCTPGIIKRMVVIAEGFYYKKNLRHGYGFILAPDGIKYNPKSILETKNILTFSTLIHRAMERWNKIHLYEHFIEIDNISVNRIIALNEIQSCYEFKNYQKENLTELELALLHCLVEILKEAV